MLKQRWMVSQEPVRIHPEMDIVHGEHIAALPEYRGDQQYVQTHERL